MGPRDPGSGEPSRPPADLGPDATPRGSDLLTPTEPGELGRHQCMWHDGRGPPGRAPRPATPEPLMARPEPSLFRPSVCSCSVLCVCSSFCVCTSVCLLVRPTYAAPGRRSIDRPPASLPLHRARPTLSRPPVPPRLTTAAPRPVPPLRRPTESQTVAPRLNTDAYARRGGQ